MLRQFFGSGTDSARANTRLVFIAEDSGGTGTESDDEETGERAPILLISPNYVGFDIVRVVVGGYVVPIAGRPSMDDGSELLNAVLEPPGSERVLEAIAQDGDLVFEYVSSNGDAFRFLYARYEDDQFDGAREQFERCVDGR